ncbi:hypothetical protein JOS77_10480 [Chromobacterium haemolyticum]|nr:hypothetical protein JOS77_10480 [Chromobacterium haemolyticum]
MMAARQPAQLGDMRPAAAPQHGGQRDISTPATMPESTPSHSTRMKVSAKAAASARSIRQASLRLSKRIMALTDAMIIAASTASGSKASAPAAKLAKSMMPRAATTEAS